jgi:hypothetical protein
MENVMTKTEPALPTNCAFVVQFRPQPDATRLRCEGRIEHLVSGQATHFSSWEHLQTFIEQVLSSISAKPP